MHGLLTRIDVEMYQDLQEIKAAEQYSSIAELVREIFRKELKVRKARLLRSSD